VYGAISDDRATLREGIRILSTSTGTILDQFVRCFSNKHTLMVVIILNVYMVLIIYVTAIPRNHSGGEGN